MKSHLKNLFSDSVIYGLSGIVTSFIGVFLIPIYTKIFEPKDYGIIALLGTTSAILYLIIVFNTDNSAAVWFWNKPGEEERRKTFSSWFLFLIAGSILVGSIFIFFPIIWSKILFHTIDYARLVRLFGWNVVFISFQKMINIWYRMNRKPIQAVSFALFISLLTIGLNILFVVKLHLGLNGAYTAQLIASIVGFIMCIIILRKWITPSYFDKVRLREMLVFAIPLLPASIMYWLMNSTSTYFLNFYTTKSEIGLYQIGSMAAGVFNLGVWAFMQAWAPFALSIVGKDEAKQVYSNVLELYCIIGLLFAFLLGIFAEDILRVFTNEKYLGAKYVIGILAVNVLMQGIPQILSIANAIAKSNLSYAKAIVVGAVITIILFNILIPRWGKEGAALSILAGNLIVPFYHAKMVQKIYPIPYNFKRIFQGVLLIGVFFILGLFLLNMNIQYYYLLVLKITISIISILILALFYRNVILLNFLKQREIAK